MVLTEALGDSLYCLLCRRQPSELLVVRQEKLVDLVNAGLRKLEPFRSLPEADGLHRLDLLVEKHVDKVDDLALVANVGGFLAQSVVLVHVELDQLGRDDDGALPLLLLKPVDEGLDVPFIVRHCPRLAIESFLQTRQFLGSALFDLLLSVSPCTRSRCSGHRYLPC